MIFKKSKKARGCAAITNELLLMLAQEKSTQNKRVIVDAICLVGSVAEISGNNVQLYKKYLSTEELVIGLDSPLTNIYVDKTGKRLVCGAVNEKFDTPEQLNDLINSSNPANPYGRIGVSAAQATTSLKNFQKALAKSQSR